MPHRLMRHVRACNNATLPGSRLQFVVAGRQVGWVQPALATHLELPLQGGAATLDDGAALPALGRAMADGGLCAWRDEAFDVRAAQDGPVVGTIDRGALPALGLMAVGVHLNGLVTRPDGLHLWVARRASDKKLDPGKLDHIVGGGVPAGLGPAETLVKEAAEEAGLTAAMVAGAVHCGTVSYAMDRPEGLRRDTLHCYDLELPADFVPKPVDGEVAGFELWPVADVIRSVRDTDDFKFNVNLVLIDLFLRRGLVIDPALRTALANPA